MIKSRIFRWEILGLLLGLGLLARAAGGDAARPSSEAEARELLLKRFNAQERSIVRVDLSKTSAHREGKPGAPIAIIEFTDFECPRCRAFYLATYPHIESALITPGTVEFLSENFYLNTPEHAKAALAAGSLSKYWEMKDLLLTTDRPLNAGTYAELARELGLDPAAYQAALASDAVAQEAAAEKALGRELGIVVTPSFIVGWKLDDHTVVGARISGPKPWTFFRDLVDQMIHG